MNVFTVVLKNLSNFYGVHLSFRKLRYFHEADSLMLQMNIL